MKIKIDNNSGFCFGVVNAIETAERYLENHSELYCLGDIVHNNMEVERLQKMGLKTITHSDLNNMKDATVLLRAHGEPPSTYKIAMQNNIKLVDASCPVVLRLQNRVFNGYNLMKELNGQVVIYGKEGHAEVLGLAGQTKDEAIIIGSEADLDKIDFHKPIELYSQTTKGKEGFASIIKAIERKIEETGNNTEFLVNDTLCGAVSNRAPHLREFAKQNDVIIFVSGEKSSNGKYLFGVCKENNENSYFISTIEQLKSNWFKNDVLTVGICGATSTPMWLMEEAAGAIKKFSELNKI
ncbi:MAG: 4-hydroxy-3-methylbut-2-enyl diphosphate reductase [Bacteroidetes bacterium CG2_30_33_31]|nr:MAG: 4-hydroxy-3-methylbut-2-enyl diphosphate reductase [Bacteroidetes bacterium CG2_30_33_31]